MAKKTRAFRFVCVFLRWPAVDSARKMSHTQHTPRTGHQEMAVKGSSVDRIGAGPPGPAGHPSRKSYPAHRHREVSVFSSWRVLFKPIETVCCWESGWVGCWVGTCRRVQMYHRRCYSLLYYCSRMPFQVDCHP